MFRVTMLAWRALAAAALLVPLAAFGGGWRLG